MAGQYIFREVIIMDIDEIKKAQEVLKKKLHDDFSNSAKDNLVNGIGIGKNEDKLCLKVNLVRKPDDEEKSKLPKEINGVKVKYDVIGNIKPL
jgi:hypothetical protein